MPSRTAGPAAPRHPQGGWSLVEVVVATFVSSLVTLVLFAILASTNRFWTIGHARMDVDFETERGLRRMLEELRSTHPAKVVLGAEPDVIRFKVPQRDAQGAYVVGGAGQLQYDENREISYFLDGGNRQIRRTTRDLAAGALVGNAVIANDIQGLTFTLTASGVETTIQAGARADGQYTVAQNARGQVGFRNADQILSAFTTAADDLPPDETPPPDGGPPDRPRDESF